MSPGARARAPLAAALVAVATLGACAGTPTPLAPALEGSVGAPQQGVLTAGVELAAEGPGFARFREHGEHHFGRPYLVRAIEDAAARVARERPGAPPLLVGDLSARRGGPIPGHRTHRSGRDVDLLFYVTTPAGAPVRSPGFVHFEADGLARIHPSTDYVRLDVERNWALVRALLESPHAEVVWLFCSRTVEALLIDHARARGEPLELVWRAESVLLRPADSAPHDDHFHLRVACDAEDAVRGCLGGGPRWPWLSPLPTLTLPEAELVAWAGEDDPLPGGDAPAAASPPEASAAGASAAADTAGTR